MKRIALFFLPVLATLAVVGIWLLVLRPQRLELGPAVKGAEEAVVDAVAAVAEKLEEAIE